MVPVRSRASAAMISASVAAQIQVTPAAVWPAGTFSMETLVWRSVPLGTTSSEDGAVLALPSARSVLHTLSDWETPLFKVHCLKYACFSLGPTQPM